MVSLLPPGGTVAYVRMWLASSRSARSSPKERMLFCHFMQPTYSPWDRLMLRCDQFYD